MTSQWYIDRGGREAGPLTYVELQAMARAATIGRDTQVRHPPGPWVRVDSLPGFEFPEPSLVETPRQPPPLPVSENRPPVVNTAPNKKTHGYWQLFLLLLMAPLLIKVLTYLGGGDPAASRKFFPWDKKSPTQSRQKAR